MMADDHTLRQPLNPSPRNSKAMSGVYEAPGGPPVEGGNRISRGYRSVRSWNAPTLMRYLRYINIMLATGQALAGIFGLFEIVTFDITSFLIAVYVVLFAFLLLAFECRFASMEPWIRRMFGFLFTYRGRTAFILAVGFMDFGMDNGFAWLMGILMCLNTLFCVLLLICHPEFRSGHLNAKSDVTQDYAPATEEAHSLLAQNPQFAAKAGAAVGSFVAEQIKQTPQMRSEMIKSYNATLVNNEDSKPPGNYMPPSQA